MIFSTGAEYCLMSMGMEDPSKNIWTIFSVYSNGKAIFKLKKKKPHDNEVECINGLRTFSIFWIVLLHSYILTLKQPMNNPIILGEVRL